MAHHQDDSVETVLLNLLRGTGIHGLTGIHPRQGHIVRPLLCVSRKEIENWLERQGQDYVTDSSNLVADVWRNKLRLNVIPQLLDITPQAPRNILNTAGLLAETAQIADEAISKTLARMGNDNSLSLNKLLSSDYRRSILFAWLGKKGFSSAMISQIAQQIDILPTILGMLGYSKDYLAFGIDVLNTPAEDTWAVNYLNGIYQYVKYGYVLQFDGQQTKAVYRLDDRLMKNNLKGKTDVETKMERELKAIIQQYMERMKHNRLQPTLQ